MWSSGDFSLKKKIGNRISGFSGNSKFALHCFNFSEEASSWLELKSRSAFVETSRALSNEPQCPPLLGFPDGSVGKESACSARDASSIPGAGRSLGGGSIFLPGKSHGQPWWATVYGITKSQTWLNDWTHADLMAHSSLSPPLLTCLGSSYQLPSPSKKGMALWGTREEGASSAVGSEHQEEPRPTSGLYWQHIWLRR